MYATKTLDEVKDMAEKGDYGAQTFLRHVGIEW